MSYDNPRYAKAADTYARELIQDLYDFISTCESSEMRLQAQQLISQVRFSEITLASAERALARLEGDYLEEQES